MKLTKSQKIVTAVIAVVTLIIIITDIILATTQVNSTYSYIIQLLAHKYPIIPFAVGVLAGHWFLPVKKDKI